MYVNAHKYSCRSAALLRRIRHERARIGSLAEWTDDIEVRLPSDYDGDQNVTFRDVLNDKVPHARLKVAGKVMSKNKVAVMVAETDELCEESREIIRECTEKLNALGVKA